MKRLIIYLTSCLLILLAGCDSLDKNLEIDPSFSSSPVLVVNGEVVADSVPILYISKTLPVNLTYQRDRRSEVFGVKEATVQCYINDILAETQTVRPIAEVQGVPYKTIKNIQCLYQGRVRPKAGDKVRFEISSPEMASVKVEVHLPIPHEYTLLKHEDVQVYRDVFYPQKRISNRTEPALKMQVGVQKTNGHPDMGIGVAFYEQLGDRRTKGYGQRMALRVADDLLFSKDAVSLSKYFNKYTYRVSDHYRLPYGNTADINGSSYTMTLIADCSPANEWLEPSQYRVVINSMDSFYYEWAQMRYGFRDINVGEEDGLSLTEDTDSPLSEPILDITNVQGGRGMVIAYTRTVLFFIDES